LIYEDVAVALDGQRVAESVQEWLKGQGKPPKPHPLEAELEKEVSADSSRDIEQIILDH
jgi:hypothetical protein